MGVSEYNNIFILGWSNPLCLYNNMLRNILKNKLRKLKSLLKLVALNFEVGSTFFFLLCGTIVTKKTIGNTLRHKGLKSCSGPQGPPAKKAHVRARLKFSNEHLNDS